MNKAACPAGCSRAKPVYPAGHAQECANVSTTCNIAPAACCGAAQSGPLRQPTRPRGPAADAVQRTAKARCGGPCRPIRPAGSHRMRWRYRHAKAPPNWAALLAPPGRALLGEENGACDAGKFLPYNMVETSRLLARISGQNRGHYWHLRNAPTGHEVSTIRDKKPPSLCENGNLFRQRRYPSRLPRIS